jgi:hypothetical protein
LAATASGGLATTAVSSTATITAYTSTLNSICTLTTSWIGFRFNLRF